MTTVVEVNAESCGISVSKGFLLVSTSGREDKIPLDDIEALVINAHGACITNGALMRLGEEGIPIVHCGRNAQPCCLTLPYGANIRRKDRIEMQIGCSLPLKKNLWQQVVKAKITNQAAVLSLTGKKHQDLDMLARKVLSGDTGNAEAVAARFYWERLMGSGFKRDPDAPGINAFLNYGYAILRAAMCRNIVASGLLPELGIHHHNQLNPYCLADDLMEPYRPYTDLLVCILNPGPELGLATADKKRLVAVLDLPLTHENTATHLRYCLQRTVEHFIRSLSGKKADLSFPVIDAAALTQLEGRQI